MGFWLFLWDIVRAHIWKCKDLARLLCWTSWVCRGRSGTDKVIQAIACCNKLGCSLFDRGLKLPAEVLFICFQCDSWWGKALCYLKQTHLPLQPPHNYVVIPAVWLLYHRICDILQLGLAFFLCLFFSFFNAVALYRHGTGVNFCFFMFL